MSHKVSVDWVIGVSLAVTANVIGNIGVQFITIAHHRMEKRKHELKEQLIEQQNVNNNINVAIKNGEHNSILSSPSTINNENKGIWSTYLCNPLWICGFIFQLTCSLMDFSALGFAPQSVIAPIGSLAVVVNFICTPIFQNEKPDLPLCITTIFIVIGSVVTTVFSPKDHNNYNTVKDVIGLYYTTYFMLYAIVVCSIMLILLLFHEYSKRLKKRDTNLYQDKYFKLHRFSIATLSGTMGAQNILFAKGVSTMIVFTVQNSDNNGNNVICFVYWEWYILLISMLCSVWFQLKWLNYGLKYFSPMQIIPVFQSFWTLIGIFGGLVVFQEYDDFLNTIYKVLFTFGVIIIVSSSLYLTTLQKAIRINTSFSNLSIDDAINK